MKILSTDHEKNFTATIKCDCGTLFEFDAQDMIIKGDYCSTYHVTCPTCQTEHNYTDTMLDEHKKEVDDYINSCRSCSSCKYMAVIEEGYSSYTVTNISIHCKMDNNPYMPLTGFEGRQEKESVYAFAEKCGSFRKGVRYKKEVEQSETDAFKKWETDNNNYSDW